MKIGHPKTVDHVGCFQGEGHRNANRYVNLICSGENAACVRVLIAYFPPPLMPGDFNVHALFAIELSSQTASDEKTIEHECKQNRDGQCGRGPNNEATAPLRILRFFFR